MSAAAWDKLSSDAIMTTDITALARDVVDSVAPAVPFLVETGEKVVATEAIKRVGAAGWALAQNLWTRIHPKFVGLSEAQGVLEDLAQEPEDEDTRGALRRQLKKLLAEDSSLVAELATLIGEAQKSGDSIIALGARSVAALKVSNSTIITGDNNKP